MPSEQAIFDNIFQYTAEDLVKYIREGITTFDRLCDSNNTNGNFSADVRREVKYILENSDEPDWQKACEINTADSYQTYLDDHPDGAHRDEARNLKQEALIRQADAVREEEIRRANAAREEELRKVNAEAEQAWALADKNSKEALQQFVNSFPACSYADEARDLLRQLQLDEFMGVGIEALKTRIKDIETDKRVMQKEITIVNLILDEVEKRRITKADFLEALKDDHNLVNSGVIRTLFDKNFIALDDFVDIGIDRAFIEAMLRHEMPQQFMVPIPISSINRESTEIYFWGIPSSGKSCALGAILSVADNGRVAMSMAKDSTCQGYGYMIRLATLFRDDGKIGVLPEGTSIYSTYEMGFNLHSFEKYVHPITCIDLAGELVRCMYKYDAHEDLTQEEAAALQTLTDVMVNNRSGNRKLHFFVIEYGADDRMYEGLAQRQYLDAALQYINRTNIFQRDTDGIYLLISKVDKAKLHGAELQQELRRYISDRYQGFYNGVKTICEQNQINGGEVGIIPFSLGEVCFQDYCRFNANAATSVVKLILDRTGRKKTGMFSSIINAFKR